MKEALEEAKEDIEAAYAIAAVASVTAEDESIAIATLGSGYAAWLAAGEEAS